MNKAIASYEQWDELEPKESLFDKVVTSEDEQIETSTYYKRIAQPEEPKIERRPRSPFAVYLERAV
ncbi:hypothetical protein [Rossellomorea marisflavi]|uniref:hypothetical protein n=1 Tax=Rossellomorea marisflavi TaxID=189381 RepID=UPI003FA0428B